MKIDWTLYDPGLEDGSISVNDVILAEDCCCGTVYNHCRVAGIRLKGKGKREEANFNNDHFRRYGGK